MGTGDPPAAVPKKCNFQMDPGAVPKRATMLPSLSKKLNRGTSSNQLPIGALPCPPGPSASPNPIIPGKSGRASFCNPLGGLQAHKPRSSHAKEPAASMELGENDAALRLQEQSLGRVSTLALLCSLLLPPALPCFPCSPLPTLDLPCSPLRSGITGSSCSYIVCLGRTSSA